MHNGAPDFSITNNSSKVLRVVVAAAFAALAVKAPPALADLVAVQSFRIPAQSLSNALIQFSKQADVQVVGSTNTLADLNTAGISGEYSGREALRALLKSHQLTFEEVTPRSVRIVPKKSPESNAEPKTGDVQRTVSTSLMLTQADEAEVSKADTQADGGKTARGSGAAAKGDVEEMIVEDTKIKPFSDANVDLPRTINDPQPYYIFDSETIEKSAAVNLEDFLKQRLTMNTAFQASNQLYGTGNGIDGNSIPGSNNSAINLRGIGIDKTLILVNGRRMAGVNYSRGNEMRTYQPDLNGIPLAAVERIEVLPSSASAIYGGSAMGGVINVILKKNFQGGEVRYGYSMPSHSSASNTDVDATYGLSFEGGKSHLTLSGHYGVSKPMRFGDRVDFMYRAIDRTISSGGYTDLLQLFGEDSPIGTTTNVMGRAVINGQFGPLSNLILDDGTDLGTPYAHIAPGSTTSTPLAQRFIPGLSFTPSPGYGPYGLRQEMGTPAEIKSFNAAFTRQMTPWLDAFAEFMRAENIAETSYNARDSATSTLRSTSPVSPFQTSEVRVKQGPTTRWPLYSVSVSTTMTTGLKARLLGDWTGQMDYTLSKNNFKHDFASSDGTWLNRDIQSGRIDVLVDPAFLDLSRYFSIQPYDGNSQVNEFAVRLVGPVFRLPWGNPTLAIGMQRSTASTPESSRWLFASSASLDGDPSQPVLPDGTRSLNTYFRQSQTSDALYLEGTLPLITPSNAVPLMRSLSLQIAHRSSRYLAQTGTISMSVIPLATGSRIQYSPTPTDAISGVGGTPNHSRASYVNQNQTYGLKFMPTESITVRASYASAFLPPSYSQLIPDQTIRLQGGRVTTSTGYYLVDVITGGNPNLKPQSSKNLDAGLIFEPQSKFLKGFRLNLEYYNIGQYDFIGSLSPDQVLSVPELAAERVTRNPTNGLVTLVDTSLVNISEYSTSGTDVSLSYNKPTSFGTFDFNLMGTQINYERRQLVLNGPMRDYVAFTGRGGPVKHKANFTLNWAMREWVLGWGVTRFGNYRVSGSPGDPVSLSTNWVRQGSYSIPVQVYHQLFAGYTFAKDSRFKLLANVGLQLNVSNAFNTAPPYDVSMYPYFVSPLGDIRLRSYAFSVKKAL